MTYFQGIRETQSGLWNSLKWYAAELFLDEGHKWGGDPVGVTVL